MVVVPHALKPGGIRSPESERVPRLSSQSSAQEATGVSRGRFSSGVCNEVKDVDTEPTDIEILKDDVVDHFLYTSVVSRRAALELAVIRSSSRNMKYDTYGAQREAAHLLDGDGGPDSNRTTLLSK
ncbi:hypothetical protein EYF80_061477 [Liparis tanakae]|uniref:Uncharacterized protein n=1 Tax=Liparis tanakae TaxID=230148 RepID=A0A4Z2EHY3_9TELE|nr:hypothetical protein EYF80_061477 [Liparis tanakae]